MTPTQSLVGRAQEIEECRAVLERSRCLWIRGSPGVGKSALARALAAPVPGRRKRRDEVILLDDVDDDVRGAEAEIAARLAAGGPCVVATARSRPQAAAIPVHVVRPLSSAEAGALLRARMEALVPGWEVRTAREDDWAALEAALDGLPLAAEIVATLLRDHPIAEVLAWVGRDDVVRARAPRGPAHHASFLEAVAWQLALLPDPLRRALRTIAVFRSRVPYELLLRAASESDAADPRATVTALFESSLLEAAADRSPRSWLGNWVGRAVLAAASDAERAAAERSHARVIAAAAREHVRRAPTGITRSVAVEELVEAARHLAWTRNEPGEPATELDATWVRLLLDDVEIGLGTRDDPDGVRVLIEALPERLGEAHPLTAIARLAHASRRLLSGEPVAEPAAGEAGDDLSARRELFRARAAWMRGALGDIDETVARGLDHARKASLRGHVVALLTARGAAQALRGDSDRATATLELALEEATAFDDDALVANVELRLGGLAAELGRMSEAVPRLEHARTLAARLGHERLAWLAACDLAIVRLEEERPAEIAAALVELQARARPSWRGATVVFYTAVAEELAGESIAASRTYVRALVRARQTGNQLIEAMAHALRGRLSADHGELASAERDLAHAEALFAALDDPTHGALVDLARGHLELARGRARPEGAAQSIASASARVARQQGPEGAAHRSFDVRLAARTLAAAITAARGAPRSVDPPAVVPVTAAMQIERTGRWFQLPFGDRVSIDTRGALRKILAGLALDRIQRPGRACSPEEVFALGWPNQRCLPESAQARVYVAISSLRRLGLRDVLRRAHDGYFFDPDLELAIVD